MTRRPTRIVLFAALFVLVLAAPAGAAGAAPSFVDAQVKANVLLLRGYIDEYAIKNAFAYPPAAVVKKGGGLVAPIWPANPWTGRTMVPGRSRGSYTYSLTATGYRLVGHLSRGTYKVTGGLPSWLQDERDTASKIGVTLIAEYVRSYAGDHADALPTAGQVAADGDVGKQIGVFWPVDPWTTAPMTQGTARGQYTYAAGSAGAFTLRVHLAGGTSWPAPGH
jgi:hypothetical protein